MDISGSKFIDEDDIELGICTRQVVDGGKLDPQYKITVPKDFMDEKAYG
nr:type IV toxin-antitoxin system AbiEi family antitoxin domain-containing protein [Yersinia kristensenii]